MKHDLTKNIADTCDDTWSLVSLVSAGLGISVLLPPTGKAENARRCAVNLFRGDHNVVADQIRELVFIRDAKFNPLK